MKQRLDQALVANGLTTTRSQAESWIRLGKVFVNGKPVTKPGHFVDEAQKLELRTTQQYVSRAGLKLASVATSLGLDFADKVMLDVGSSTGGFTDYALQHGVRKVIAVEVGTHQLHPSLLGNPHIELHEQTDIRDVRLQRTAASSKGQVASEQQADHPVSKEAPWKYGKDGVVYISEGPDIVVIDVSFISLRDILPQVAKLSSKKTIIVAMVKPQFEAVVGNLKHKGVIKNDRMRRDILKDFEQWAKQYFVVADKADSEISGAKGNLERFYRLQKV